MTVIVVDTYTHLVCDNGAPVYISTTRHNLDRAYDDAQKHYGYPLDRGEWEEGDEGAMICAVYLADEAANAAP